MKKHTIAIITRMEEYVERRAPQCDRARRSMCAANFLLVTAMVMQVVALAESGIRSGGALYGLPLANVAFVGGLFVTGPVCSFMVDKFRRKNVFRASMLAMAALTAVLYFGTSAEMVAAVRFMEGVAYALAQVSLGSTMLNDLTPAEERTSSDYSFAWAALMAVPAGACLAYLLMSPLGMNAVIAGGAVMLLAAAAIVSTLTVPFRAPIHPAMFSLDRFWQKDDLIPFVNLFLISVSAGVFIGVLSNPWHFVLGTAGVAAARAVRKSVFRNADVRAEIMSGMVCVCFALLIFLLRNSEASYRVAAFMFGAGISICSTRFLLYFLKLTGHCQRGTAQNTYMLARECGYAAGFLLAFCVEEAVAVAFLLAVAAVAFYPAVTHRWFLRHNDRDFKFREV